MRRTLTITGAAGVALCLALSIASLWMVTWRHPTRTEWVVGAWSGMLIVSDGGSYTRPGWDAMPLRWRLNWWPYDGDWLNVGRGGFRVLVPLWAPTLIFGALLGGGLVMRRPARRDGECAACGYDLRGLNGACPECGRPARRGGLDAG